MLLVFVYVLFPGACSPFGWWEPKAPGSGGGAPHPASHCSHAAASWGRRTTATFQLSQTLKPHKPRVSWRDRAAAV